MRLYQVKATECNGTPEYAHSKLLAAENIDQAWADGQGLLQPVV